MDLKESKGTILFYYSIFNIGGAERSTSKLITNFLDLGYNVDVLLITRGGDFQESIDKRAKVKWLRSGDYGSKYSRSKGMDKIKFLILYTLTRLEELLKSILFRFKKYNVAIISLHGLSPKFCLNHINATKYLQLVRNDLKNCDQDGKARNNIEKYGEQIDHYVCVSQTALDSFIELFPKFKAKGIRVYNLLEEGVILEKASWKEDVNIISNSTSTTILTVCRIQDKSKGLLRLVDVCSDLLALGHNIQWFIIGDGPDTQRLKKYIEDKNLSKHIFLLGQRSNPYPYFRASDLVAVLSYYEGLCGVVNEAKILKRPLIATRFSGVEEQINSGVNGIIVDNDKEAILSGLDTLLNDKNLLKSMAINDMPESITNDRLKMKQLISLFE